jgi:hypothetical protein
MYFLRALFARTAVAFLPTALFIFWFWTCHQRLGLSAARPRYALRSVKSAGGRPRNLGFCLLRTADSLLAPVFGCGRQAALRIPNHDCPRGRSGHRNPAPEVHLPSPQLRPRRSVDAGEPARSPSLRLPSRDGHQRGAAAPRSPLPVSDDPESGLPSFLPLCDSWPFPLSNHQASQSSPEGPPRRLEPRFNLLTSGHPTLRSHAHFLSTLDVFSALIPPAWVGRTGTLPRALG